ncbi:MAG: hypothetical protein N2483_10140 [Burkholderiaceae bacterium]|nr:hypothetical protein [Burkholderiaceae bacterium]
MRMMVLDRSAGPARLRIRPLLSLLVIAAAASVGQAQPVAEPPPDAAGDLTRKFHQ